MSGCWIEAVVRAVARGPIVRAVVIEARGSTPREVGAWMLIGDAGTEGTIGGGALEQACIARAFAMLADDGTGSWSRAVERFHLGPELNQCCGGAVAILLERFGAKETAGLAAAASDRCAMRPLASGLPIRFAKTKAYGLQQREGQDWWGEPTLEALTPLLLYGAGHVGRALFKAIEGLPFSVTWLDGERDATVPSGQACSDALVERALAAPPGAFHLVMTHSHTLDEAVVAAILRAGNFGYLGLIGSATKRARFRQRLLRSGLAAALVDQMRCPIGLPGLEGKAPPMIAASVAADLLLRRQKHIDHGKPVQ